MGVVDRADAAQRRHGALGFPIAVIYKFADDRGPHLAALLTYYALVSLFPLLLLFVSVTGFVLQGNPELQHRLVNSALADFPLFRGRLASNISGFHGNAWALIAGVAGTLYGGLGVMQAAQAAFNRVYAVPRNEQPNPVKARLRSLLLLVLLGGGVLLTTALNAAQQAGTRLAGFLGPGVQLAFVLASFALSVGLFTAALQLLTARDLRLPQVLRGGLLAAVGWQGLQYGGGFYLSHELSRAGELYGAFGLVLGLIAWIYLEAFVLVLAAEVNVVADDHLWPRALATPFTDNVVLTAADRRCYASYARSERFKGNSRVEVRFSDVVTHEAQPVRDQAASAQRSAP